MTDTPEDPQEAERREAHRWTIAANELTNASNMAEDAADLLADNGIAAAFDTVRTPSPAADVTAGELRSIASRLATASEACRDRADAINARLNREDPQP